MYESRIASDWRKLVFAELNAAHHNLGNGSQIVDADASATGMRCARLVGVIHGLNVALQMMEAAEKGVSVKPDKDKEKSFQ